MSSASHRSRRRSQEPQTIESLMEGLMTRLGGHGRAREHRVFGAYEAAVGPMLRAKSEPEALRGSTLVVRVSSSALAHQITMLKAEILGRMSVELAGAGGVTDLRTKVGPLGGK